MRILKIVICTLIGAILGLAITFVIPIGLLYLATLAGKEEKWAAFLSFIPMFTSIPALIAGGILAFVFSTKKPKTE